MVIESKKKIWSDFGQKSKDDGKGNLRLFYKFLKGTEKARFVLTQGTEIMSSYKGKKVAWRKKQWKATY